MKEKADERKLMLQDAGRLCRAALRAIFPEHRPLVCLFLIVGFPWMLRELARQRRSEALAIAQSPFIYTMQ